MVESEHPLDDLRGAAGWAVDTPPAVAGDPAAIGPYRVLGRLGAGGMGTVYLAQSPAGARVAIKIIRPELAGDAAFLDRFRREVAAARRVAGFCTARVLDANLDGSAPYLVTEYVDGVRLDLVVERDGPLAASNLEGLAVGVAAACAAIHAAEVVHRDLKRGNVLLSYFGPRVIDFGIARALDDGSASLTRAGTVMGTPAWMAPEQFGSAPVTTAADIFAWGGLVAYAGTGRLAFGRGPVEVLTYRILHAPPDLDGLAEPLRPLVERAMAKDAALRPSARALLAELVGDDEADPGTMAPEVTKVLRRTWVQEPARGGPPPRTQAVPPPGAPWPSPASTPPQGWAGYQAPGGQHAAAPPAGGPRYQMPGGQPPVAPPGGGAGPGGWGTPPPAGRRVPGKARLRGVLVALAIVVVGVLAALNDDGHGNSGGGSGSDQGGSDHQSGAPATRSSSGSDSQAGGSRTRAPYGPVRDGKFEFRVTRFGCGARTLGSGPRAPRAEGKFCLVTMQVRNIGRVPQTFDANAQELYAVGGASNQVDGAATLLAGSKLLYVRVNPGNSVSGTLVYDVHTSFRPASLEVHDSPASHGAKLLLG